MTHDLHMRVLGHRVMRYAGITLGCLIASCAINLFLIPAHLLTGGATGIAMIVYYLFGLPMSDCFMIARACSAGFREPSASATSAVPSRCMAPVA